MAREPRKLSFRAIVWAEAVEPQLDRWFSSNPHTDCAFYPEVGQFVVMNNSEKIQRTVVRDAGDRTARLSLAPMEMRWFDERETAALFGK